MRTQIIVVEGKEYLISFDINTLCLMEADGLNVMALSSEVGIATFRKLMYYGLYKYHKKGLTLEEAGRIMTEYVSQEDNTMDSLAEKLTTALEYGLGGKPKIKEEDKQGK